MTMCNQSRSQTGNHTGSDQNVLKIKNMCPEWQDVYHQTWSSRIEAVESHNLVLGLNIIVCSPAVVSIIITFPLDKILNEAPTDAAVKDPVNLKLLITFNQDRWRWKSGPPARDGALEPNWNNHYSTTKDWKKNRLSVAACHKETRVQINIPGQIRHTSRTAYAISFTWQVRDNL